MPGLQKVYGILFYDFKALDVGGPQTIAALKANDVQIGLLFSTDPTIRQNGFVPLVDDKHLQTAENITPVMRSDKLNDEVRSLLDAVSAPLSTDRMTGLIRKVVIDGQTVAEAARGFLATYGLF
jgi:osmoprotectant transport system substrate-binding protein